MRLTPRSDFTRTRDALEVIPQQEQLSSTGHRVFADVLRRQVP